MKIILGLFLCLGLVIDSFGSPLIFKTSKVIKDASLSNVTELASLDASKYKDIRIVVITKNDSGKEIDSSFRVYALENNDEIYLDGTAKQTLEIHNPPTQIKIKTVSNGNFNIYVYGS